jgi:hypothetical protein
LRLRKGLVERITDASTKQPAGKPAANKGEPMDLKQHWETVYATKEATAVSWYEATPALSLQLIEAAGLTPHT